MSEQTAYEMGFEEGLVSDYAFNPFDSLHEGSLSNDWHDGYEDGRDEKREELNKLRTGDLFVMEIQSVNNYCK